jgi:hypothetical protein
MRNRILLMLCCALFCAAIVQPLPAANAQSDRQVINGTAYFIGGGRFGGGARSRTFRLIVNSYTPANQVRELNDALQRSQDEMLRTLSRMDAGRISIGSGVGVDANAIIADPWDNGGTKLTVLYERNVTFFELRAGSRSTDYRFGYAEIFLDRNGRGEGTLIGAARIRLRGGNTWEVEDFGTFPARLMGLRSSGSVRPR